MGYRDDSIFPIFSLPVGMPPSETQITKLINTCDAIDASAQVTPASHSSRGYAFFVTTDPKHSTPAYVLKLAKLGETDSDAGEIYRTALPSDETAVRTLVVEATVLAQLQHSEVPVPEIVDHNTEVERDVPPYILMKYIPGTIVADAESSLSTEQRADVIEQLGRSLGRVHETFSFDRFGELAVMDGNLQVVDGERYWRDRFEDDMAQSITRLEQTPIADLAQPARDWFEEHQDELDHRFESTLIHEDLNPLNVIISTAAVPEISAIVDWEDVTAAPPELQIESGVTLLDRQLQELDRNTIEQRFVRGYETVRRLPDEYKRRSELYALRRWVHSFSALRPDLDTSDGQGAAVERAARDQFKQIV